MCDNVLMEVISVLVAYMSAIHFTFLRSLTLFYDILLYFFVFLAMNHYYETQVSVFVSDTPENIF